ncbi:MAG: hydroxymethylglutaryl-CoA synthase [Candidatus Omnitrophota bacterium]|jgi:hydroxymethylglutaryl-CoA synthase
MRVGIDSLSIYTPGYYLDLALLAERRNTSHDKYVKGIGQERMAVPAPDEDVVTMGTNAALEALVGVDRSQIDTLIFATESGIDQSKAAGIYVHSLLGLPSRCRTFEVKQACCSSTAALQMALASVALKPSRKALIVASDVARYGFGSAGEPTQGAGAIAMVVSANPRLVEIHPAYGAYTEDVMDFWRPNYMSEAVVDGKYSIKVYMNALLESWNAYREEGGLAFEEFSRFCYHLPFTRMAEKAHRHLARHVAPGFSAEQQAAQIDDGLKYNRLVGNCYTASLYIGLLSMLENCENDLSNENVGLFSYGSGCMGSFFGGTVQPGYREVLNTRKHQEMLAAREALTFEQYEMFYNHTLPEDGSDYQNPRHRTGAYRFAGVSDHKRLYEPVDPALVTQGPQRSASPIACLT